MNFKKVLSGITVAVITGGLIGPALLAGDVQEKKHEVIVIKKQSDDGKMANFEFDSEISGVFLNDIADGESQSTTTKDGKMVTISRVGKELHIDADGEKIVMPYLEDNGDGKMKIIKMEKNGNHAEDIDVNVNIEIPEGLSISSSRPLDVETQKKIRTALTNAGIQDPVHFNDGQKTISKTIIMSDDGEMKHMMEDMGDAEIKEFTTDDGKHVKIIKKRMVIEEKE
jgi:hypothetical protein